MPKLNLLSNVNPAAVSLVEKGANRKRFFLKKADGSTVTVEAGADAPEGTEPLIELPSSHRIVKADDWSAVYCVVAEPDATENPGLGAEEPDVDDMWASPDEIRKAAHAFARNGGLVNKMHEDLEPYGAMVETYVVPDDFAVGGDTIKKGSWVVAIEPNDEGKAAIESGTFTGVSIQGSGVRTPQTVAKSGDVRVSVEERGMFKRLADYLGITPPDDAPINKELPDFTALIAREELDDELPKAWWALRDVVWGAFALDGDATNAERVGVIETSLGQFGEWASSLLDRLPIEKREALSKELDTLRAQGPTQTQEDETTMDETRIDKLEESATKVEAFIEKSQPVLDRLASVLEKADAERKTPDAVAGRIDELETALAKARDDLDSLADGGSTQPETPDSGWDAELAKTDPDKALARALLG